MNAIDELIEQARQEEVDRKQATKIFEAMKREATFQKCQDTANYIESVLGKDWKLLEQFMIKKYNENGSVLYQLPDEAAETLNLIPFKIWTAMEGSVIHFENEHIRDRIVHDQKDFAHFLMIFREDFPAWNEAKQKERHLQELRNVYEYDLIAWSKECDRILAANRVLVEAAQRDIPSFEIYDLEYGVFLEGEESKTLTVHDWILERYPNGEGFYRVIDRNGKVTRKLIFYPVSVCAEAVIIDPGLDIPYCCGLDLRGGALYYGPNVEIDEYIPTLLDPPEKPSAPEGLPDWDRVSIETKIESMDVSQL